MSPTMFRSIFTPAITNPDCFDKDIERAAKVNDERRARLAAIAEQERKNKERERDSTLDDFIGI